MRIDTGESFSSDDAANKAIKWCEKHKGWKRICDIKDSDILYKNWDELNKKVREYWIEEYGKYSAESAWREFGDRPCKVPYGFITGKGEFYKDVLKVPRLHNLMMIFKIS